MRQPSTPRSLSMALIASDRPAEIRRFASGSPASSVKLSRRIIAAGWVFSTAARSSSVVSDACVSLVDPDWKFSGDSGKRLGVIPSPPDKNADSAWVVVANATGSAGMDAGPDGAPDAEPDGGA